ncbi:AAA family ATPase [Streptomyces sp. SID13031]|uniref:ATP-binding protein n=1 Tax=Streptomyces sp. SID13031 TaxID=2706046 RepID=UPI0013C7F9F9|nr:AAA family ATPase [Streptomyces sp. SID13031]NEA36887.1 helix-turn-helix transcriptional regulator [Streptomyces sp. SID13031]
MSSAVIFERDAEFSVLDEAVAKVGSGSSAVVVISGAAGIGKTQLLDRTREAARGHGLRVLFGRGSPLEREYSYGLVRQLFEPLLAEAEGVHSDDWMSDAAAAAKGVLLPSGQADDAVGEFAALHGLFWLTSDLCRNGPLVLAMDDLHWADEPSLRFVAYLLPRLEDLQLLLLLGMRPDEPGAATSLLDLITVDSASVVLRPAPLSPDASADLLAEVFGRYPEGTISAVCHEATGGNPFLLAELGRAARADGVVPTDDNAEAILRVGAQSLSRRTSLQLGRMAPEPIRLAEALAVLGPGANLVTATRLSGLTTEQAASSIDQLESAHLIRHDDQVPYGDAYGYVHPLLEAAVYGQIKPGQRARYHTAAARGLVERGAPPEQVAAHLLRLPPEADATTVAALRHAADAALTRGAPEAAVTYLRRALAEPPPEGVLVDILTDAGMAAARIDLPLAADYLSAAMELQTDPVARAQIAHILGMVLMYVYRVDDAVAVLTRAIASLPPEEDDLNRTLHAALLNAALVAVDVSAGVSDIDDLRGLHPLDTLGGRLLDAMIEAFGAYTGDPQWTERNRTVAADPALRVAAGQGIILAALPFWALVVAGDDAGVAGFTAIITEARRSGATSTLVTSLTYRGLGWIQRGDLAEAESDLREAERLAVLTGFVLALPILRGLLAEALAEQGKVDEAAAVVSDVDLPTLLPITGLYFYPLQSKALVLAAQGRHKEALEAALAAGARLAGHANGQNPAVIPWRSQAASCLYALGRLDEAAEYVTEEIELARRWGAPFAIGRALRVAGRITWGKPGVDLLRRAVEVLEASTAHLEHAKALVDLGAAVRRSNARVEARAPLAAGLDLAFRCGAAPLVELARAELRAAGARPRRMTTSGPDSLTTSERRVADLAASDLTNRQIAQELFVTIKTVEVHLSAAYRKLGIAQRGQLHRHLAAQSKPA